MALVFNGCRCDFWNSYVGYRRFGPDYRFEVAPFFCRGPFVVFHEQAVVLKKAKSWEASKVKLDWPENLFECFE